jgi:hypothetical protein
MNWKMNIWTLLFTFSLAALVYLNTCDHKEVLPSPIPVDDCKPDSIPFNTAEGYMLLYEGWRLGFMEKHKDSAHHYGIKNPEVMYFALDSCELAEMVKFAQHGKVYAFLAVKDSLIDLLFLDENPYLPGAHSMRAFDFSTPCPTLCDPSTMTK